MKIALDAMGGDKCPGAPVSAAVKAALERGAEGRKIVLVGPVATIEPLLGPDGALARERGWLELKPADEVIGPEEHPVAALRQKKNSTISVGLDLVKDKTVEAFVSAGSTGALMAGAFRAFGRIRGVPRPALAGIFPSLAPGGRETLLLDLGANADARPEHLRAYAVMGAVYAEKVMGRQSPRVGLLSIGAEEAKGNALVKEAHRLMAETSGLDFAGNVEGRDLFAGRLDVVVTDGFTGNVVIKVVEGLVEGLFGVMKEEFLKSARGKVGALLLKSSFRAVKRRLDYSEYGGAPFLGVGGAAIKCHGTSGASAIVNGIGVAERFVSGHVIEIVSERLAELGDLAEGDSPEQPVAPAHDS